MKENSKYFVVDATGKNPNWKISLQNGWDVLSASVVSNGVSHPLGYVSEGELEETNLRDVVWDRVEAALAAVGVRRVDRGLDGSHVYFWAVDGGESNHDECNLHSDGRITLESSTNSDVYGVIEIEAPETVDAVAALFANEHGELI